MARPEAPARAPLLLPVALAAAACLAPGLGAGAAASEWEPAARGYDWNFPADHWAHDGYRNEWWYFVGFGGPPGESHRFAWQFTVFRSGIALFPPAAAPSPWGARHAAMGHLAVADLESGERVFSQTAHREAGGLARFGAFPDPGIVRLQGPPGTAAPWVLRYLEGRFSWSAADDGRGVRLELEASPTLPPLLHGAGGFSQKGEGGAGSLYYSQTRLRVTGSLVFGGGRFPISGTAWMDREFGSAWLEPGQTGWDWFGLNLADGRDLMLYLLRRRDGGLSYASGTLRDGGTARPLVAPRVETLSRWTPPDRGFSRSGGRPYPSGWRIEIPAESLDLTVLPLLEAQENRKPPSQPGPDIPYWEGRCPGRKDRGSGPLRAGLRGTHRLSEPRGSRSAGPGYNRGFTRCRGREGTPHDGRNDFRDPLAPCLRRDPLDRTSLLLQLRQRSDGGEAGRSHETEGRARAHAAGALLVPLGRRLDLDHRSAAAPAGLLPRRPDVRSGRRLGGRRPADGGVSPSSLSSGTTRSGRAVWRPMCGRRPSSPSRSSR